MLDRDHTAFIQSGVSISVAACGPDHLPSMSRGLGCKVVDEGRQVGIFVRRSQSIDLLENVRQSGRVANVFSLPSSNRTVQIKGIKARVEPFDSADLPLIETHLADFLAVIAPVGIPENVVRTILSYAVDDLATIVYSPSEAFSQTPGPKAGEPLAGKSSGGLGKSPANRRQRS